jgi:hypothetical protein
MKDRVATSALATIINNSPASLTSRSRELVRPVASASQCCRHESGMLIACGVFYQMRILSVGSAFPADLDHQEVITGAIKQHWGERLEHKALLLSVLAHLENR